MNWLKWINYDIFLLSSPNNQLNTLPNSNFYLIFISFYTILSFLSFVITILVFLFTHRVSLHLQSPISHLTVEFSCSLNYLQSRQLKYWYGPFYCMVMKSRLTRIRVFPTVLCILDNWVLSAVVSELHLFANVRLLVLLIPNFLEGDVEVCITGANEDVVGWLNLLL